MIHKGRPWPGRLPASSPTTIRNPPGRTRQGPRQHLQRASQGADARPDPQRGQAGPIAAKPDEVRPITAAVGVLPKRGARAWLRPLFQPARCLTQVAFSSCATLGTPQLDAPGDWTTFNPMARRPIFHHYQLPPLFRRRKTRPMRLSPAPRSRHGRPAEPGPDAPASRQGGLSLR